MSHAHELHYVVVVKQGYICGVEAGPFLSPDDAESAIPTLPEISKSCRYAIATQEVYLTIKE